MASVGGLAVDVTAANSVVVPPPTSNQRDASSHTVPIIASPLAIGVASIASGVAASFHVPVPSTLSKQIGAPSSTRSSRRNSKFWAVTRPDGDGITGDDVDFDVGFAELREGLDAMLAAASEGNVMSVYTVGLHGDVSPSIVNPVALNPSSLPTHLQTVPFPNSVTGLDALRRQNVGRRPSVADIENSIHNGKWSRSSSGANTPAIGERTRVRRRTDLNIISIGFPGSEDTKTTPTSTKHPMKTPLHSGKSVNKPAPSPGSGSFIPANVVASPTPPRSSTVASPVQSFCFTTPSTDSPRSTDKAPTPLGGSPRLNIPRPPPRPVKRTTAKVDTLAIWRRARAAFLKYARERSDELEELYEEQRKGAVAAVEAGIVVTVDCGVSVPLKFQGDLAHYSVQALRQRRRMRRHIGVKEAIQRHWDLLTSMKPEDAKYVTKDEYIAYFLVAYGVLMPDEDVETSAKLVAIEADWESDSRGEDVLDHAKFYASLFELVDNWCETISAVEYIRLLDSLYEAAYVSMIIGNEVMNALQGNGTLTNLEGLTLEDLAEECEIGEDDEEDDEEDDDGNENGGLQGKKRKGGPSFASIVRAHQLLRATVARRRQGGGSEQGEGPNRDAGGFSGSERAGELGKEVHPVWKSGWKRGNDLGFAGGLDPTPNPGKDTFRSYTVFTTKSGSNSVASSDSQNTSRTGVGSGIGGPGGVSARHRRDGGRQSGYMRRSRQSSAASGTSGADGAGDDHATGERRLPRSRSFESRPQDDSYLMSLKSPTIHLYKTNRVLLPSLKKVNVDQMFGGSLVAASTDHPAAGESSLPSAAESSHGHDAKPRDLPRTLSERRMIAPLLPLVTEAPHGSGDQKPRGIQGQSVTTPAHINVQMFREFGESADLALSAPSESPAVTMSSPISLLSPGFDPGHPSATPSVVHQPSVISPQPGPVNLRHMREQILEARELRPSPVQRLQQRNARQRGTGQLTHESQKRLDKLQRTSVSMADLRAAIRAEVDAMEAAAPTTVAAKPVVSPVQTDVPTTSPANVVVPPLNLTKSLASPPGSLAPSIQVAHRVQQRVSEPTGSLSKRGDALSAVGRGVTSHGLRPRF